MLTSIDALRGTEDAPFSWIYPAARNFGPRRVLASLELANVAPASEQVKSFLRNYAFYKPTATISK